MFVSSLLVPPYVSFFSLACHLKQRLGGASRFPQHNLSLSPMAPSQPGGGRGQFNAGRRRTRAERMGGGGVLISRQSESVLIIHQSSCSFFTQNHLDLQARQPQERRRGQGCKQPMRKSPAFFRSHKHTLSRTRTHTRSQTDSVTDIGNTDLSSQFLSISISGKIWHLSAMSHRPPLRSSSPAPGKYGERERQVKKRNTILAFEFVLTSSNTSFCNATHKKNSLDQNLVPHEY